LKETKNIKVLWPNNKETFVSEGDDWFSSAKKAGLEIPTGCLTGSCGACEIDENGKTVRACISNIKNNKTSIIAEIKKASPSAGIIIDDYNPVDIAQIYLIIKQLVFQF